MGSKMAFGSLDTIIKIVDFLNVPIIEINSGLCSDIRIRGSCQDCKDLCPTNAIDIGREISIDPKKCVRCGGCATICQNGVYTILDGSDETLLNKIDAIYSSGKEITIQCNGCDNSYRIKHKKLPKDMGMLTVPCLGRVNEIFLLRIRELDFNNVIFSDCISKCPYKSAWDGFYQALILNDHLRKTITDFSNDPPEKSTNQNKQTEDSDAQNRRDFVLLAGKRAAAFALDINPSKRQITKRGQRVPLRRRILIEFLNNYEINDHMVEKGVLPFSDIEIIDSCDICAACCHICPTGALAQTDDDQNLSIIFEFQKCIGCELCEGICDKRCLEIKNEVNLGSLKRGPVTLYQLPKARCSNCEMGFVSISESSLCPQCEIRNNLKMRMSENPH
jgi:ferredoxin